MQTPLDTLKHHVTGAIERSEAKAIACVPAVKKTFRVFWSPEGKCIATVRAFDAVSARRMAPMPYRKFIGEIYAEETIS